MGQELRLSALLQKILPPADQIQSQVRTFDPEIGRFGR